MTRSGRHTRNLILLIVHANMERDLLKNRLSDACNISITETREK